MQWLVISVVLSVVLTVVVNIGIRAFPGAGHRAARSLADRTSPTVDDRVEHDRRIRVIAPWKAMVVGSVILTVVVNVVLWIL